MVRGMIKKKKKYVKPEIKKIRLDAKTAVLAVCKTAAIGGPAGVGCGPPETAPCQDAGS